MYNAKSNDNLESRTHFKLGTKINIRCILVLSFILIFSLLLASCAPKAAEVTVSENMIDEESALETVKILTSEKYKGRLPGTEENEKVAEYIAEYFQKMGLESPKELKGYMQKYNQPVILLNNVPSLTLIDKDANVVKDYVYTKNFTLRSLSSATNEIDIKAPMYLINDLDELKNCDEKLKNKVLLIPLDVRARFTNYDLIKFSYSSGAKAAIGEYDIKSAQKWNSQLTVTPMLGDWLSERYNPFINVDNDTFAELVEASKREEQIQYKCSFTQDNNKVVNNVIGVIEGIDSKLKNEYIIIGAHFDHVGDNKNGTYNPGALDNASGTAAMMEIAKILSTNKVKPKKTILFIAFNGEEGGLLGSEYYVNHPVFPLKNSRMINLDMVGSSSDLPLMISSPRSFKGKLDDELYSYATELGIQASHRPMDGSDHENFGKKGVDSVMLIHDEVMNGYHSPNDTVEDVSSKSLEQVIKLVLHYIYKNAY